MRPQTYTEPPGDRHEHPLLGGDVTEGLVRIGDTVRRPEVESSEFTRRLLTELNWQHAPRHLGIDAMGRDVLEFIPGEVAAKPWPQWMLDDDRIASLARLVRAYDDRAAQIGVPEWATTRPDPAGTPENIEPPELHAHMDLWPENVVWRGGTAHALIDFDLARPASRVEEVCNLLLWWAPWMPADDREPVLRDADHVARARVIVDAYGLGEAQKNRLVPVSINLAERSWHFMKWRAETYGGGWQRMWGEGVGDKILRRVAWLKENSSSLVE